MKAYKIFALMTAFGFAGSLLASCDSDDDGNTSGSSTDAYFFEQQFEFDVTANPVINIPVVRLGTSGDLSVNVSATGSSEFTVPQQVVIKDGQRMGSLEVAYNKSSLQFNEVYTLELAIQGFNSKFGFEKATATIEYPTSYYEYGSGHIVEGWWGEEEDKTMYARDYGNNVYQCYLPDCWGDQSGAGYPVQNYVWFWNTVTNKVYVPVQAMGCEDWCVADRGAVECQFRGPNYKVGSAQWMQFIDDFYAAKGFTQPYYDPDKKAFYLAESAAVSPVDGSIPYGSDNLGVFDVFTLK